MDQNYYEILEVYPAAQLEEIETNYRMLLYKYHPDHNPDRQQWAHEMTAKVVEAYQCLSNPEKRILHNFQIYCPVKKKPAERKFMFFQGKDKKAYEAALPYYTAGVALFNKQKAKSIEKFKEALVKFPKFTEAIYNIGLCLVDMRKFDEARQHFNKVKEMNPKSEEIVRTLRRLDDLTKNTK